jgi:DNA invertase Pin-like site-specific DNA recombinase
MCGTLSVLAEFERDIIRERVMTSLKAARARDRKGGRPKV